MDLDNNNYEIEPVTFPYVATLPCGEFQNYCKNMHSATKVRLKMYRRRIIF